MSFNNIVASGRAIETHAVAMGSWEFAAVVATIIIEADYRKG